MAGWRVLELWIIRIRLSIHPSHRLVQCVSPPTQPPSHGTMPPSSCRYRVGTSRPRTLYMRFHLFSQCIVIDTQSSASLTSKRAIREATRGAIREANACQDTKLEGFRGDHGRVLPDGAGLASGLLTQGTYPPTLSPRPSGTSQDCTSAQFQRVSVRACSAQCPISWFLLGASHALVSRYLPSSVM